MKAKSIFVFLALGINTSLSAQTSDESKKLIRQFIEYSKGDWNIDTAISKYILFRKEESKVATKEQRKKYIEMGIKQLSSQMKEHNVNPRDLTIETYEKSDPSLKILNLDLDYSTRTYVVCNKQKSFVRYFLIRNRKIEAFLLYRDKAFLLLN
ncbi:hypothetical protein [Chitinophaga sp.]|uniref:hypothetical protein n=1 Tax=Chitinophaga sp. TaxID=1869181 RepID=UPI0031DC69C4